MLLQFPAKLQRKCITAFSFTFRNLRFMNPAKQRHQRIALRKQRRESALRRIKWYIFPGDKVFVLNHEYKINPELFASPNFNEILFPERDVKLEQYGSVGEILEVFKLEDCVTVSDVNVKRADLYNEYTGRPMIEEKPRPVAFSRIFLLDPVDNLPTDFTIQQSPDNGRTFRLSVRSQEHIPFPKRNEKDYETHVYDTSPDLVAENTYKSENFCLEARTKLLDKETIKRKAIRLKRNKLLAEQLPTKFKVKKRKFDNRLTNIYNHNFR